jgi:serine/threonine-protein kinase
LLGYVAGGLLAEEVLELERHVDSCPPCRQTIAGLTRLHSSVDCRASRKAARLEPTELDPWLRLLYQGVFVDRYELIRPLGSGGSSSIVWLAHDVELGRNVAVKMLRSFAATTVDRLRREAQAMAKLRHPNVISIYDFGRSGAYHYITMEYVQGQTLAGWLATRSGRWQQVVAVMADAGRGLAAAHRAGLIHRDFKPANILIGSDGRVQVGDFGLVATVEEACASREKIVPLQPAHRPALGTTGYIAPEVYAGRPATVSSDQFSFCVTLFESLCGRKPYVGSGGRSPISRRMSPTWPDRCRAPQWVRAVVERGLSLEPERRFASLERLLVELSRPSRRGWVGFVARALEATKGLGISARFLARRNDGASYPKMS